MDASRGGFKSKLGFIAAAAGSAVGLGNIWKFPYETGANGGATFLFIYLICIFLIGFPIMVGEIAIGRRARLNPAGAYTKLGNKNWGLLGLWGVLCGFMILSFYNVIAGWAFGYFLQFSFGDLINEENFGAFFGNYVSSPGQILVFAFLFMMVTAYVVAGGVQKGIERFSKILMPVLLGLLVILIIYGLTLDHAMEGVKFYLIPTFDNINAKMVNSAMGQAFFSLSLGMGALITYGSYIGKDDNIISSAGLVTITDTLVAFLAGLLILPLVFYMQLDPHDPSVSGPPLVFIALPGIFQSMGPLVGRIVGGGFFLLLCFAALTSTISLLEVPVAYFVDQKKWVRKRAVLIIASIIFILGIPSALSFGASDFFSSFIEYYKPDGEGGLAKVPHNYLDFIAALFSDLSLPMGGFLMSLFIAYKWKIGNMAEEISQGNPRYKGSPLEMFVNAMILVFCPLVLGAIFVINILEKTFGVPVF